MQRIQLVGSFVSTDCPMGTFQLAFQDTAGFGEHTSVQFARIRGETHTEAINSTNAFTVKCSTYKTAAEGDGMHNNIELII